ncbi:MAG: hypothetical protein O2815_08080 [Actinomycetota bacterium]|nr:hypothetical protein [Actinomycetota bacterium]
MASENRARIWIIELVALIVLGVIFGIIVDALGIELGLLGWIIYIVVVVVLVEVAKHWWKRRNESKSIE